MNNLRQNIDIKNSLQTTVYITPQMKQSLAMLQMPLQELSQEITNILAENPILETIDEDNNRETDEEILDEKPDKNDKQPDIVETVSSDDWQEYIGYESADDISYRPMNDDEQVDFEEFVGSCDSLQDHLLKQLKISMMPDTKRKIGEYIIGNLSEDGYFRMDMETAAEEVDASIDDFLSVLKIIKTFDPAGVASETLSECIITQMKDNGCDAVYADFAEEILTGYTQELALFKYDEIMRGMGIERDTFEYILALIRKTDPRPGLNFDGKDTRNITPDVFIVRNGENFDILLNEAGLPAVRLNSYYVKMLKNIETDDESKQYIKDKVKNAVWVIESLQKRQKAIYKVVKAIVHFQLDFLKYGVDKIKPLKLREISDITELHTSTISRVTNGKYAMTEHGLIELKSFFIKTTESDDGGIAVNAVKSMIKEMIDAENPIDPISDQKIVELIDNKGVKIARRTVAKYRDEMNIPTMSQRKRLRR